MASLRRFFLRLFQALRSGRTEAELDREVAAHLALLEEELVRRGSTPEEAKTAARRSLGGVEQAKIRHRDARSFVWLDELAGDLRQVRRSLVRNWPSTVIAILILGVVGAANAVTLGVADGVLFRPLPYTDPGAVRVLMMRNPKTGERYARVPNEVLQHLRNPHSAFSAVAFQDSGPRIVMDTPDGPLGLTTRSTTPNYFEVLGIRPIRGRLFVPDDGNTNGRAALITYRTWHTYFGGREDIVGKNVTLGNASLDVVGILPPGLFVPDVFASVERPHEVYTARPFPPAAENSGAFYPVVRLAEGVSGERAQGALTAQTSSGVRDETGERSTAAFVPADEVLFPTGRPIMRWLLASTIALLLLACVNLATLLLIRGHDRAREVAVKMALGASRARIIRPLLFEIVAVSVAAGFLAVGLARAAFAGVMKIVPQVAYGQAPVGIDPRVGAFSIGLVVAAAVIFTFTPGWLATRRTVRSVMAGGASRGATAGWTFGRPLLAFQVAMAVVLVFGAVTTGRAFVSLLQIPLGFDAERVATVSIAPPAGTGAKDFALRVLDVLRQVSGVVAAGAVGSRPFDGSAPDTGVRRDKGARSVGIVDTLPGYFEAIGVPVLAGRIFSARDPFDDPDAAVVTAPTARELFGDRDPIGQVFDDGRGRQFHVIGVIADFRKSLTGDQPVLTFASPPAARRRTMTVVVKTRGGGPDVLEDLKRVVRPLSPAVRVGAGWLEESISAGTEFRNPRFQATVLTTLGGVGLLLTSVGIVGVVGFLISSRSRELGVRTVIGATPGQLVRQVVSQALLPVTIGLVAGLVLTRWAGELARAQLFRVETDDPALLVLTASVIVCATLLAAYLPARRAGRVDPAVVLRGE